MVRGKGTLTQIDIGKMRATVLLPFLLCHSVNPQTLFKAIVLTLDRFPYLHQDISPYEPQSFPESSLSVINHSSINITEQDYNPGGT